MRGNPNVGKSTIFNNLTGLHQHTGNWPGKTVSNACGLCKYKNSDFLLVDIPGTYSILSNSQEEEIARDYICFSKPDATIVVVDATCLERNLNLVYQIMEITNNVIVCVNLLDEAKKKNIKIDLNMLSKLLGVPVCGTIARKKKSLNNLLDTTYKVCKKEIIPTPKTVSYLPIIEKNISIIENKLKNIFNLSSKISRWVALKFLDSENTIISSIEKHLKINISNNLELKNLKTNILNDLKNVGITQNNFKDFITSDIMKYAEKICQEVYTFESQDYSTKDRKIDKILTSKYFGIPIMLLFLGLIFWITIIGANYPSQLLFNFFDFIQKHLINFADFINCPYWLSDLLILGIYRTLTWVISVMLPPMAIFFPLFTFLEDLGYLPRLAFNVDGLFKKCCCSGKQMITMCLGVTKWKIF